MNGEEAIIWKEAMIGCLKVQLQHFPGQTEENHDLSQDSHYLGWDFECTSPEEKFRLLPLHQGAW
jgi:hypothetical protein